MTEHVNQKDYLKKYGSGDVGRRRRREALTQSLDIRKFEIELYWKRAAYFWTFIAATFGAYFLLQKEASNAVATYIVTCLGLVFSVAWYFVNRGSKNWQRNWETQVDLLEDEFMGPLHKTTLNRYEPKFFNSHLSP